MEEMIKIIPFIFEIEEGLLISSDIKQIMECLQGNADTL